MNSVSFNYSGRTLLTVIALSLLYIVFFIVSAAVLPASAHFYPATAIAFSILFFGGRRLWPAVYALSLFGTAVSGMGGLALALLPAAITLQAAVASSILLKTNLDPLFRRLSDVVYIILVSAFVSFIPPVFEAILAALTNTPYTLELSLASYMGAFSSFLVMAPFCLRWITKPAFRRPKLEWAETAIVFICLIALDYIIFMMAIRSVSGIPIAYTLLLPFSYIALRLRPRFVTLALVVTAFFAVAGAAAAGGDTAALASRLFATEAFLAVVAIIFYIIVSLEEERRVSTNLIRSQLHALENAFARISSESIAKNNFIAILGHELRNPLAPIEFGIDILKMSDRRNESEMETLTMMGERMDTVRRLLEDLLDISRISEGKMTLRRGVVNINTALKKAILSTEHHRKELHQSIKVLSPQESLYVSGDSVRIEQIFSNLLTNASKYSHEGDRVRVLVRKQGAVVEIEVADEGVGISSDSLENIFIPFRQIEQSERPQRGLGIGLALVHMFAQMHQGSVFASSKGLGHGSSFTVRLPLMRPQPQDFSEGEPVPAAVSEFVNKGLRVLVVDDNDKAAAGIGRLLELHGCTIRYAYTGDQAIESALNNPPDVIVLDVGLPDKDGYTVAKQVRAQGFAGRIIMLTGYGALGEQDRREFEGIIDHHLIKPASLADLKRVMPELSQGLQSVF